MENCVSDSNSGSRYFYMLLAGIVLVAAAAVFGIHPVWSAQSKGALKKCGAPVTNLSIVIEADTVDKPKLRQIAEDLILIDIGTGFSDDLLKKSVKNLELCGKFTTVKSHVDKTEAGLRVTFALKPAFLIKDIDIIGAYPLFDRDILNIMSIYPGEPYLPAEIENQQALVQSRFKREGFIQPGVSVSVQQNRNDPCFTVQVKIDKGAYYRLKTLTFNGNQAFSGSRLKLKMKTWRASTLPGVAGRFIEQDLADDIRNLIKFYRGKGFADVAVSPKNQMDTETGDVTLQIDIKEGLQYEVEIEGNDTFWTWTLKKDIVLFTRGNEDNQGIRESRRNLLKRYNNAGFPDADVKLEERIETGEAGSIKKVCFFIEEGPRSIVESMVFDGNRAFDEKRLKKQMLTRPPGIIEKGAYVPKTFQEDIYALKTMYLKQGYTHPKIRDQIDFSEDRRRVKVKVKIDEGVRTTVSDVRIRNVDPAIPFAVEKSRMLSAIDLRQGAAFREYMIESDRNTLAELVSEQGYPHVDIEVEIKFSENRETVDIEYIINNGPHVKMGNVYYSGSFQTKERIINNEIEIETGDPFSLRKIVQSQKNLREMDLFNSVKFKVFGLKEKAEQAHLIVEVEEKKPYHIELGGGYDTQRSVFIHFKAGDRNLFGAGKDVWVSGEWSGIGYRGESGITDPRLFTSRVTGSLTTFFEREEEPNKDFGVKSHGASLSFNKKWYKKITTSLGFNFEKRTQFDRDANDMITLSTEETNEYDSRHVVLASLSGAYDRRDSFIRPKKGVFASCYFDISNGIDDDLDDFLKYGFDVRYYWTPLPKLTFALSHRWGHIEPYGSDEDIPDDQRFFLGGISDVRGFKENMLAYDENMEAAGGRDTMSATVEARIDMGMNVELALFYDMGIISGTDVPILTERLRSSVGAGLRYHTPIGPVGLLYGIKLNRQDPENLGRLHFSIGYTF